jgi:lysophosphatidylcholine acyltransferase / lyso-PAF acetyltransferase
VETFGKCAPITVFPEGGTSNGKYLLPFKRGAFAALRSVKPVVLKYSYGTLSPAWDVIPFWPLIIMQLSLFDFSCEVIELPTFTPNDYLFTNHADKGKEQWEIYAWAVRDVMSRGGNIEMDEGAQRDKLKYEAILGFRKKNDHQTKNEKQLKEPLIEDNEDIKGKGSITAKDIYNQ